ncbi:hypothetical protein E2P81_ATG08848 [Venturia nashicola]|nr:hypothetical protein E2P81_ATG08848 [Venturia nashicola]
MISVGDTLMLSQASWRLSRAFTAGRANGPCEFREVESELVRLTKSLKLLAESLFLDHVETIISQTDHSTQAGIETVVRYCKRTLEDLESLIDDYQIVRKTRTSVGYAVERAWSPLVLSQFKTMAWTAEGGNLYNLRDRLHMHASTIAVIRQALESKFPDRVEWTVAPISEGIHNMVARKDVDTSEKIEEIERVVQSLVDQSPALGAAFDRVNSFSGNISALSLNMTGKNSENEGLKSKRPPPLLRRSSPLTQGLERNSSISNTSTVSSNNRPGNRSDSAFSEPWATSSCSSVELSPVSCKPQLPSSKFTSSRRSDLTRSLPPFPPLLPPALPGFIPILAPLRLRRSASDDQSIRLPPAKWDDGATVREHRPNSHVSSIRSTESAKFRRTPITISQQATFKKELFQNSAIYCDLRGKSVQYIKPAEEGQRPSESQIEEVMEDCRICVVRRKETYLSGRSRFTTSIWAFSDDRTVRFQHELPDLEDVIPFSSFFQEEKISITMSSTLTFHGIAYGSPPLKTTTSKWVNYIFEDEYASTSFQNTLFGRTLLDSYKTEKTTRTHDGFAGALSSTEQMCAMENLRLWEEEPSGAVMAMIHYSANFRDGYLTFYINDTDNPIKIKDDGGKTVRIKGLKIAMVDNEFMPPKRSQSFKQDGKKGNETKKWITGAKIEFDSLPEKVRFLDTVQDLQVRAVNLRLR